MPKNQPVLTVDLKKKRIRLYKHVLRLLDDPEYVQFLINPEKKIFIVRKTDEKGQSARKIYWTILNDSHQCCEFYSQYFVEALQKLCFGAQNEKTYRVIGWFSEKHRFVVFNFNDSEPIEYEAEAVGT